MSVFVILCFGAAVLLGAIAVRNPPAPPAYNFLAGAVAFVALGLLLQSLTGLTG